MSGATASGGTARSVSTRGVCCRPTRSSRRNWAAGRPRPARARIPLLPTPHKGADRGAGCAHTYAGFSHGAGAAGAAGAGADKAADQNADDRQGRCGLQGSAGSAESPCWRRRYVRLKPCRPNKRLCLPPYLPTYRRRRQVARRHCSPPLKGRGPRRQLCAQGGRLELFSGAGASLVVPSVAAAPYRSSLSKRLSWARCEGRA